MSERSCCFIGHRKIENKLYLYEQIKLCVENLITKSNITIFLFGSHSEFNDLCLKVVSDLKDKYPYIKRVYIRAEYEYISDDYKNYLLTFYEETYYSEKAHNANKLVYVKRNEELIDSSNICVFYYKNNVTRSGTTIAFEYAQKRKKKIIEIVWLLFDE
ncbi:MAG: hypothetical protein HFK08_03140 [Clostridia bacterium]|nr:hypothetical protein [Clostridia bacterium]